MFDQGELPHTFWKGLRECFSRRSHLRIALIAPLSFPIPPTGYGGTERVVDGLARGLESLGHSVTLYASGDSRASRLRSLFPRSLGTAGLDRQNLEVCERRHVEFALAEAHHFDILHDHTKLAGIECLSSSPVPVLTTVHNDATPERREAYRGHSAHPLVALSQSHAQRLMGMNICAVVPNGVDPWGLPFSSGNGDYFAFLGRLDAAKGADRAARLAAEFDWPLLMAGPTHQNPEFYRTEVLPWLNGKSRRYIGELGGTCKWSFLAGARALLFPICWPEPFGLVMIEAMAVGTPVLATDWGAVREIVVSGQVGEVVGRDAANEDFARAAQRMSAISRAECRAHALRHYSVEAMTRKYVEVYQRLVCAK